MLVDGENAVIFEVGAVASSLKYTIDSMVDQYRAVYRRAARVPVTLRD